MPVLCSFCEEMGETEMCFLPITIHIAFLRAEEDTEHSNLKPVSGPATPVFLILSFDCFCFLPPIFCYYNHFNDYSFSLFCEMKCLDSMKAKTHRDLSSCWLEP